MVDVLGHVAVALLWAVPARFLWRGQTDLTFVGLALLTAMAPDVDLYLPGIVHHGVTHTLLFVAFVSTVVGLFLTRFGLPAVERRFDATIPRSGSAGFVVAGLLLGGTSHVFADLLSTSVIEQRVEPFWPFFDKPFSVYLIQHYSAPVWNGRLLVAALAVHLVLSVLDVPTARRPSYD